LVAGNLRSAGFKHVEIVPTNLHPLVYAESLEAPGKPTILFYGHYDVHLALVVGGTATRRDTAAKCGFESAGPEIERLGGLPVVMAVKKDGGLARSFQRFRVDQRVEIWSGRSQVLKPPAEVAGNPIGAALDIGFVFALGANMGMRRNRKAPPMLVTGSVNKVSKDS